MLTRRLMPDALVHIVEIGIGMKPEQRPRLPEHLRRAAGDMLAHAIGDHVLDRDDRGHAVAVEVDQDYAVPIGHAVEQGRRHDLEAEPQVGVDPAQRRVTDADRLGEPLAAQLGLELLLPRGDDTTP